MVGDGNQGGPPSSGRSGRPASFVDTPRVRVLLVSGDDSAIGMLAAVGFEVERAAPDAAAGPPETQRYDLALVDVDVDTDAMLELCRRWTAHDDAPPVIVTSARKQVGLVVSASRAGATDFLPKPLEPDALATSIHRVARSRRVRAEVERLRTRPPPSSEGALLGESGAIREVRDLAVRLADSDVSVLVLGESGTGKEVVAREIHRMSRRAHGPFVAINCAAVPEHLLESELFGHAKGAFTGALEPREGLLLAASGGTLFLDEIGDMPMPLQPKLLRVLQDRTVRPLGVTKDVPFDARIITATSHDLDEAVRVGRFRADLHYRINVVGLSLPPLRDRGRDVLLLAQDFLEHFARASAKPVTGLSSAAAERLLEHHWPGNVRELRNVMERAVALARFDRITTDDLPANPTAPIEPLGEEPTDTLRGRLRGHILKVLAEVAGNKTRPARILGLDRKSLYRILHRMESEGPDDDRADDDSI